jgi:DNA-binding NarL/FixJ family response regulator
MVLEGEPRPVVTVPDRELAGVAAIFADLADLKSPATHGHSRGVATLAPEEAERRLLAGAREVEVLGLVAEGCSKAQIAQRLVISRRTAEHHVQHIYAKIGVSSRAAAALFAMEHHLLPGRDG